MGAGGAVSYSPACFLWPGACACSPAQLFARKCRELDLEVLLAPWQQRESPEALGGERGRRARGGPVGATAGGTVQRAWAASAPTPPSPAVAPGAP